MALFRLVLASASPRRLSLLQALGFDPEVLVPAVPEQPDPNETPERTVARLAARKSREVATSILPHDGPAVVLGADTEVSIGGRVLGKPRDPDEARTMLLGLSGREHRVLTAIHAIRIDRAVEAAELVETRVWFRQLDPATVDWYVATGEPFDKAGGYGIQERGAILVDRIDGSWSNVVGLPLERLPALFAALGFPGCLPPISRRTPCTPRRP